MDGEWVFREISMEAQVIEIRSITQPSGLLLFVVESPSLRDPVWTRDRRT
jgi:hypothetical protein